MPDPSSISRVRLATRRGDSPTSGRMASRTRRRNERDLAEFEQRGNDAYVALGREGRTTATRELKKHPATGGMIPEHPPKRRDRQDLRRDDPIATRLAPNAVRTAYNGLEAS